MSNRSLARAFNAVATLSIACLALPAHSGGLYIGEFGQPNQGASRAGGNALAEDASTAFMNPAGTMFLDESKAMATAFGIFAKTEFEQSEFFPATPTAVANQAGDGPASDGGDAGSTAIGGAFFYADPVTDKWGWSLALTSVSGAELDYENGSDFAGRYWSTEVELFTINMAPALSYKVTEDLSLGVSAGLMYGTLDLDVAIPGPAPGVPPTGEGLAQVKNGDDTSFTFGLSSLWQVTDSTRLGLVYAAETELSFDSDLRITPPTGVPLDDVNAEVEITYPQTVRGSLTHDYTDNLTLLATVAWEEWSEFKDIPISTNAGTATLPRNWDNTWFFALGMRLKSGTKWTYYTGPGFRQQPDESIRSHGRYADR